MKYQIIQNESVILSSCLGDDELEHEYRIISKSEMLEAINSEIKFCELNDGNDIAEALKLEKAKI